MKKKRFSLFVLALAFSSPLLFSKIPPIEKIIQLEWTCATCRHGNPPDADICEYCGKSK